MWVSVEVRAVRRGTRAARRCRAPRFATRSRAAARHGARAPGSSAELARARAIPRSDGLWLSAVLPAVVEQARELRHHALREQLGVVDRELAAHVAELEQQ